MSINVRPQTGINRTGSFVFRVHAQRSLIAAVAACVVWVLIGRPMESRAHVAERETRSMESRLTEFDQLAAMEPDYAAVIRDAESRKQALSDWSRREIMHGSSPYETFRAIATACKVRLQRIEPWSKGGKDSVRLGSDGLGGKIETTGFMLEVVGAYRETVMFLDALEHTLGASMVESFRFVPYPRVAGQAVPAPADNPEVTVVIEVARVDISFDALASSTLSTKK